MDDASRPAHLAGDHTTVLGEIARLLTGLRYGSVEVIVHEGVVTQIERRDRVRIAPPSTPRPRRP